MTLSQLWLILLARRHLFFLVLLTTLALGVLISVLKEKTYLSEVALVIDTKPTDPVSGNAVPGDAATSVLATHTDIIQSRNVALKVIDKLDLTKLPQNIKRYTAETNGVGPIRIWLADRMAKQIIVRPSQSNVLYISYPARDPETAAQISNALADAFIQTSLELNADPARRQSNWFDQENVKLRQRVDAAQTRLSDEQRRTTIVGTEKHIDVDNASLTEISTQLVAAQQTLYGSRTRLHQMNDAIAKDQLSAVPDILENSLLQTLKADLTRAEGNFADVASRYDRNHPQYKSAQASVMALRTKFAGEVETVRRSVEQTAQISQHQVDELQRALDRQKQTLIGAQREHDSLDVLNRELDSAQRAYDAGMQRASQVRLASQIDQSSVAVLNPALPPFKPAGPGLALYLEIAGVLGLILAFALCLMAEMIDPRVRSSAHIVVGTGLVVLAEIPRLATARKLSHS